MSYIDFKHILKNDRRLQGDSAVIDAVACALETLGIHSLQKLGGNFSSVYKAEDADYPKIIKFFPPAFANEPFERVQSNQSGGFEEIRDMVLLPLISARITLNKDRPRVANDVTFEVYPQVLPVVEFCKGATPQAQAYTMYLRRALGEHGFLVQDLSYQHLGNVGLLIDPKGRPVQAQDAQGELLTIHADDGKDYPLYVPVLIDTGMLTHQGESYARRIRGEKTSFGEVDHTVWDGLQDILYPVDHVKIEAVKECLAAEEARILERRMR